MKAITSVTHSSGSVASSQGSASKGPSLLGRHTLSVLLCQIRPTHAKGQSLAKTQACVNCTRNNDNAEEEKEKRSAVLGSFLSFIKQGIQGRHGGI